MKVLGATAHLAKRWGAYDNHTVASYLGNKREHCYLKFAQEDPEVKRILTEYSVDPEQRKMLSFLYYRRINSLMRRENFGVKYNNKQVPSVELVKEKTAGYIIGAFGKNDEVFEKYGSTVCIPKGYDFKSIQKVESGFEETRKVTGFFSIPEYADFPFYIVTRKCVDGRYYLEMVDIKESLYQYTSLYINEKECSELKARCNEF